MNKLWHFGSELSTSSYGESLSELIGLSYVRITQRKATNQSIFTKILEKTNLINPNDTILVNWVDFRRNDIVISKNNKALVKSMNGVNEEDFNDDYYFYKQQYQKFFYRESFMLFDMIMVYFQSLTDRGVDVYFLYDTIRNFLIPGKFDILHYLSNNITETSFLDFLYKQNHIDLDNNVIKESSVDSVNSFIINCIGNYRTVHSESFDSSLFPKSRYTMDKIIRPPTIDTNKTIH